MIYKTIDIRLFPTPEQEELMRKHNGACRFVWNKMLDLQETHYQSGNKNFLGGYKFASIVTEMRKQPEYSWMKEVAVHSLKITCSELGDAYMLFFNKTHGKPRKKTKKKSKISFPLRTDPNATYFLDNNYFVCPKIGRIKYKTKEKVPIGRKKSGHNPICKPRIRYVNSSKKWILTFVYECENQVPELTGESMGIDLGIKELAVVAIGDKKLVFHNINKSKRVKALEKKRKHIKRAIDRKYRTYNGFGTPEKGQTWKKSKNIEKYEQILREIEAKISNIRKNYRHHVTKQLVNMLPARIVMENLNVRGMMKNKHLSKAILEQGFFVFKQTVIDKCKEYGIEFIQADRYFPSSKLCSCCGYKNKNLKLKDREWMCPNCGTHHDRDYNAAINLMNYTENTTDKLVTKVECKLRKKKVATMTNVSVA